MDEKLFSTLRDASNSCIAAHAEELHALSNAIWEHPELNFEEVQAHAHLCEFLEKAGFTVTRSYTVDTGFKAEFGAGRPHVAILCEYDALPDIGHACGHNLIAEAGVAAGLGVKAALTAAAATGKGHIGKVTILGTPAEEGGGGKEIMIQQGAFEDVDVAMMVHPGYAYMPDYKYNAIDRCTVTFTGKTAHASGVPWEGINALDAAVLAYNNISCLRQQCRPEWRVHGIISHGGVKPNIIPDRTDLEYYVRAPSVSEVVTLKQKVTDCLEGAAKATGCKLSITWDPRPFYDVKQNEVMRQLFIRHVTALGQNDPEVKDGGGSTDMGNVSYKVPSIHPFFKIAIEGEPLAFNHQREFTRVAGHAQAQGPTLRFAKAMALTALELLLDTSLLTKVKDEFRDSIKFSGSF